MKGIKIAAVILSSFTLLLSGGVSSYAAPEHVNVVIRLDLSGYDTFDETISLTCLQQNSDKLISLELTQVNGYIQELYLAKGSYQLELLVTDDRLQLIHLEPAGFVLEIDDSNVNTVQDFIIHVSDSGSMSADSNALEHEGIGAAGEGSAEGMNEVQRIPYHYTYVSDTLAKTGLLRVTGPDIAGVQSMSFCIKNREGEEFYYELKAENGFMAEIELPYGLYKEVEGEVVIIPEEEVIIPPDAKFYYKYYGNKFGQMFRIDENNKSVSNPNGLQLWVKSDRGANYEIPNLYKFMGDKTLEADMEAELLTGHEEAKSLNDREGNSLVTDNLAQESEAAHPDKEKSGNFNNLKGAFLLTVIILLLLTGAAIGYLVRHSCKKE